VEETTRLALGAGAGDRAALATFVHRTQGEVWRLCAALSDRDTADDLTQETFLRAIPALGSFRGESSARTWLLTIARRTCADDIRRRRRTRRLVERVRAERTAESVADPSGRAELHALVRDLADDRREAFVLTQVLGLDYAEAAEVCGCPIGTIRSRVARARADLVRAAEPEPRRLGSGGGAPGMDMA
jgi:RNA polymerase sigma-70 factor (ECF subfamily)